MRRRRAREEGPVSTDRWLISYADFITLLFAFFVTMYSISTVDQKKLQKAVTAFQTAFPDWRTSDAVPPGLPGPPHAPFGAASQMAGDGLLAEVETRLLDRLHRLGEDRVAVNMDPRGLVISVKEAGSFAIGSADLTGEAQRLFHEIAATLVDIPNAVRVEGHTDEVPIHTARFASNWELSTARATTVVAYFVEVVGLPGDRLSAAGYAEFHPRVANDSPEHRAANRRVDIVVLNPRTREREEPGDGAGAGR